MIKTHESVTAYNTYFDPKGSSPRASEGLQVYRAAAPH